MQALFRGRNVDHSRSCAYINPEWRKRLLMRNAYVAPVIELIALETEDVVMISGLVVEPSGKLPETSWGDLS